MKRFFNRKNKIFRRILSFTLVIALVLTGLPADLISEDILERTGIVMNVKADTVSDELKAKYTAHTYTFTSEDPDLSEYSQCFQDATWAADHDHDTITLNPTSSRYLFDANYNPIGNASAPFYGTIYLNTGTNDFYIETNTPIFDYVKDSTKLYKLGTSTVIPLNINRVADTGDTVSPLLAKHMVGSSAETPYEWKVTLNSASAKSYSGVIYEMTGGAKVNLTFTDDSNHTPVLDNNDNISSGSIIDNKESNTNYGILCGSIKESSVLQCAYTNTSDDEVTFIGKDTAYCGGLIGEINNSTFELLSGSSSLKADFQTPKNQVGFVCGHAEGSTITLPTGYGISGTIDGKVYAGGIAGYCKNTVVNYSTTSGTITLNNCNIKNGSNATATGSIFGYYECNNASNDILLDRTYSLSDCTVVSGKGFSGGIAGDYKPTYTSAATIDLDKYTLGNSITLSGTTAGGLFGRYTASGSLTITDSVTTNTHFAPPSSSAAYGGVIGEYVNSSYSNTLSLSNFTVNNLNCTSSGKVGGVIGVLNGSTYVSVSGVSVTNATADSTTNFGGIVSALNDNNAGSFIDLTGNFTLSMASGKTYKGGAIAGSFKKGVIRLAGVTDISGAQAANGYAQLVYENDETLVYAKGNGADSNWTLKRNADTTASDLGQWGEVIRTITVNGVDKNAEDAEIVSVANNKVTVASVTTNPAITDEVSFAKVALNMQLNDGSNHGALCFASGGVNKTALLSSAITVTGEINLSGTGLLGLMRDGGNGKHLNSRGNTFAGSPDFFTGSISGTNGASTDKILLAIGETYGCDSSGTALEAGSTGGRIYLSNNWGHDAQGLISFGDGASLSNITVGGNMHVSRVAGSNHLYMSPVMGTMTNGATLTNVTVNTTMTADRTDDAKFYIGGVSGVFDGNVTTANPYSLSITGSTITPSITLTGAVSGGEPDEESDDEKKNNDTYEKNNTYAGGVLGLLKGSDSTQYQVSISTTDVSPTITIGIDVTANPDYSYIGGMIGRVRRNATNERSISLNTVTMTGASVDTRAKYSGGLLGAWWERTNLTVNGLTITGSTVNNKYSDAGSKQSGLVFKGSGKWNINSLTIQASSDATPVYTQFISTNDSAPASFGLIVNEAYSVNDGLYINLKKAGYTLTGVTVPTSSTDASYYVDEIAADTKNNDKNDGDILIGGNGTGIVNVNMNAANGILTKIVDDETPANGTGTYQNQLYSQLGNLVANQNSRYYYNLDVMLAKGTKGSTAPGGEQFLLWSVYNYAAPNIRGVFKANGNMITATTIDLSGLSYYPIPGGTVTLPNSSTVTFGFDEIHDYEDTSSSADSWKRFPDDVGSPKTSKARNQHYLMQCGLFTTVSSLSANTLTLAGDFGYVSGVASGALINKSTSGTVSLAGLTLDGLAPSNSDAYMLINHIDGTGSATPTLNVSNLRATDYSDGLPVAKSLFGTATGQNMTMNFSDIKLDARDGTTISDTNWTSNAATNTSAMNNAYGTTRSIFKTAIFFETLLAAKSSTLEYYYTVDEDWGTGSETRKVTYGKEVTDSREYNSGDGEKKYNIVGSGDRHYTNPISDSDTEFNFTAGFLPYVGNYTAKGNDSTYPVTEIKVNYKVDGLVDGCGTYNDPYIISTATQFNLIADAVNNGNTPGTIRLPNTMNEASSLPFASTWHTGTNGDGLYNLSGSNYAADSSNSSGLTTWTKALVQNYLASAYYVISADLTGTNSLPSTFEGIGKPGTTVNGSVVFHGVIVGKKSNGTAPTITNPTGNPLIYISNGSVVKNLNISVTANITRSLDRTGDDALYGYKKNDTSDKGAEYYGGVIGEIMGGDNIIDDVTVTYSGTTTLSGGSSKDYKHLIAEGGMVGCVVNGALIFRGSNSVTGRTVSGGGIYSNPFVGRVINGYAVYEKISGRTGTAPVNGSNYPIDTIDRSNTNKLDVKWSDSTIEVPDAQSLYILSLITQSIASTANTSDNEEYGAYSPSYGYNSYITGVARLGDYTDVGCGKGELTTAHSDYNNNAKLDSVNNSYSSGDDLLKAPVPYIIYRYTKAYEIENNAIISKNYPARKMTFDNEIFWDITLSSSSTFASMDSFAAFRGVGSVGIISRTISDDSSKTAMKVATFDGGGNVIKLHISLPRYEINQENYFHKQPYSLNQTYAGDNLNKSTGGSAEYGIDSELWKLMGLGLFDSVLVKYDSSHEYQFKNFTLQGTVADKVYSTANTDITGTTENTQLFCVGGVYGKRVNGNESDVNFNGITFDGLNISSAYSCGGLVGIDAVKSAQQMEIAGCNSTGNGISVTGGCYGGTNKRHGVGAFVGMTFWTRPYIDGDNSTTEQVEVANISVSNVTVYYDGTKFTSIAGGLIGYTGSGAEIKNVNLNGLGSNPVIGSSKVLIAGGFIGFTQADNVNTTIGYIVFDNCTLNGISVQAKNNAAGFLARCGNSQAPYFPRSINISNCAVIGNSQNKPEIKTYGTSSDARDGAGGFIVDFSMNSAATNGVIENSYITGYKIEGYKNTGGIIAAINNKPAYLKNIYVKDCDIISNTNAGGMIGFAKANVSGYNLKIDGVNFTKLNGTDYTGSAGIIIGTNDGTNDKTDQLIGIGAYHTTASKVPTVVVKSNNFNNSSFFVFADYMNTSASDITAGTGYASTFGVTSANTVADTDNNISYPSAPYVNTAPHMGMGTNEYITGDGASIGKAGEIYKDIKTGTSNRKYAIGSAAVTDSSVGNATDATTLANYINDDGTYKNGAFKISRASVELGTLPTGVEDFAILVINDDAEKTNDITPFIKSYIRLITNAEGSANQYKNNQYAYSYGNNNINKLYKVVVRPCYYSSSEGKFVLGTEGAQGLSISSVGKYAFDSTKADSEAGNYQFSLIDVQFKDPTSSPTATAGKIAYHLYVPVYTKKTLTAEFSAVTMSATTYNRNPYASKISSEIAASKARSILVESTNEWTTTFIRYTYPKNQITSSDNWNFDKSIILNLDDNFATLPSDTKLILVDPNGDSDKYYTLTLDGSHSLNTQLNTNISLSLSSFEDEAGNPFVPQNLSSILADQGAWGTGEGHTNDLYEDYYISIYVPNKTDGQTHGLRIDSGSLMTTSGGNTQKANIDRKLYSYVVLGDLFTHSITEDSFVVTAGNGDTLWEDNREMTNVNKVLKTDVTATVKIKNLTAGSYLSNSDVFHAFYLTLTSHDASGKVSDIIYGITPGYVHNTTTLSYMDSSGAHTEEVTNSYLGANYVYLNSGSIRDALMDPTLTPTITIHSVTTMTFNDITAFPFNQNEAERIGTQVSVKSSLAYREEDLRFSALNSVEEDPEGKFYYSKTKNSAQLSFNAVPTDDTTDEIGYKTNNRSLLGVNGKYGTQHPIVGKAIYNVDDIVDYTSAENVVYTITLYKKVTNGSITRYEQVNNISNYLINVNLTDSNSEVSLVPDRSNAKTYVYTGAITHGSQLDLDKMFEVDFSCTVLTGDSTHNEYANYKIVLTADLDGASNAWKDSYLIYTNAKFDPSVIDE